MFVSSQKPLFSRAPSQPQAGYGAAADLNRDQRGNTATTSSLIRDQMRANLAAGPQPILPGRSDLAQLGYGLAGGRLRARGGEMGTNAIGDPAALTALASRNASTWGPATGSTTAQLTMWPPMRDPLTNDRSAMAGMHGGAMPKKQSICMRGGCLTCGGKSKRR
jgi:hypothetical protein